MITDEELLEIYANAPVIKNVFEVISLKTSWFEYHLQNTFVDGVEITLEDDTVVTAEYAPFDASDSSSSEDLSYTRTINIQQVNDIIAYELSKRNPDNDEKIYVYSRHYVMYRDGTVSALKGSVVKTQIRKVSRNNTGASIDTSAKPVNSTSTGERVTVARAPMLLGSTSS